ncbi:Globin-like protein [Coniochaeta hoffmannii]|uniref:Globin-like protein n=1 Tax=Coniochaeta hoffmannii TaxID=91930 RepID=A0AA38VCP3_9PEZI|nr:Globin-like protein [Coniochaeta hoffmannii]
MTSSQRPMQHIDRKELYTNLEARIRYLHSFLDFSSKDIDALLSGAKYIRALIPAVVNIVYHKLLQYDITARAFTTRSTSYDGPVDPLPTEDSPQIRHRKLFLRAYLVKLCSDPTEFSFWEYLDKVGMMHVGLGRTHPLHVEYVHIGMALGVIQDILTEAILSHPKLRLERKVAIVKALGKVVWIQNDLFAKWYVNDGEEFTDGMDYGEIEKEGWLHGRKVLREEDDGEGEGTEKGEGEDGDGTEGKGDTTPTKAAAGVCPFTGLSAGVRELEVKD